MTMVTTAAVLLVIAIIVLALLVAAVFFIRRATSVELNRQPPPVRMPDSGEQFPEPPEVTAPRYEDLLPGEYTRGGFSSQLQTNKYNLRIEEVDGRRRYVVNGVSYNSLEEIPSSEMRKIAGRLIDKTIRGRLYRPNEILRQVIIGNQATIEAKSEGFNVSVQRQGRRTRYIVNGLTYYHLNEVPDPEMRRIAKDLMGRMI